MMLKTKVGSVDLVTNEYNNNTHMLTRSTYGNGTVFEPVYDSDYQLTGKKYNSNLAYEYIYSDQGELTTVKDNLNLINTNFLYDLSGRLVKTTDTLGNKWVFGYDTHSNMNSIDKTQFGVQEKESIIFDLDNKVTSFKLHQGTIKKLDQTVVYDAIGRIESIGTKDGADNTVVSKAYQYWNGNRTESNVTTTLVSRETIGSLVKDYTYDLKGNISSITVGGDTVSYTYDLIGQLLTEDNEVTGEYIEYDYDTGGNIRSKTVTTNGGTPVVYNYVYDSVWKDKLVSFDGKSLTYDAIGNPLSIGDSLLTWTQGRKLSTFRKDATSDTATYSYDENGIRRSKVVGDEVIEYITSGGEVVAQRSNSGTPADSSDDVVITFIRGADGSLISMNRNGAIFYYVTNIQGDVEQILDSTGSVVVSYVYDAYGRVVGISGSLASTLGVENPFRYRSYYFDSESGYYYLQSRYYDPVTCRIISADGQLNIDESAIGANLFAYCYNNPINMVDDNGCQPRWARVISRYAKGTAAYKAAVLATQKGWYKDLFYSAGFFRDSRGIYHARQDALQRFGGYNDFYDWAFNLGTSMKSAKFPFSSGGTSYILWAWKGDYLNLGAGAELGIYYGGGPHWLVNTKLAMPMSLTLKYKGNTIISYSAKAWWITGFNPYYQSISANSLTAIFTINFSANKGMYNSFYSQYRGSSGWSFNKNNYTATYIF